MATIGRPAHRRPVPGLVIGATLAGLTVGALVAAVGSRAATDNDSYSVPPRPAAQAAVSQYLPSPSHYGAFGGSVMYLLFGSTAEAEAARGFAANGGRHELSGIVFVALDSAQAEETFNTQLRFARAIAPEGVSVIDLRGS